MILLYIFLQIYLRHLHKHHHISPHEKLFGINKHTQQYQTYLEGRTTISQSIVRKVSMCKRFTTIPNNQPKIAYNLLFKKITSMNSFSYYKNNVESYYRLGINFRNFYKTIQCNTKQSNVNIQAKKSTSFPSLRQIVLNYLRLIIFAVKKQGMLPTFFKYITYL